MVLEAAGARERRILPEDEQAINELWMRQFLKRNQNGKTHPKEKHAVEIRHPGDYERLFLGIEEGPVCTK